MRKSSAAARICTPNDVRLQEQRQCDHQDDRDRDGDELQLWHAQTGRISTCWLKLDQRSTAFGRAP